MDRVAWPTCCATLRACKPPPKGYVDQPKTLGDHLRNRRLDLGLVQAEVAAMLSTTVDTIRNWEANRVYPRGYVLARVTAFVGYDPDDTKTDTLGKRLLAWRGARGIRQRELARMLGIGRDTLWSWESGLRKPQKRMRVRVAVFLEAHRDDGDT